MSIGNLDILSLISTSDISSINKLTLLLKIIGQCAVKHYNVTDKNSYCRFEGPDMHYY
jgi:hypothetical protein